MRQLAQVSALALAGSALAAIFPLTASPAAGGDEVAAPREIAMEGMEALGLRRLLDRLHLDFTGWLDQSYTFNPRRSDGGENGLRLFDDRADYCLNAISFVLERPCDDGGSGSRFDLGGLVEVMFGSDARFVHSLGLMDRSTDATLQLDPLQFYATARLPVGGGLAIKLGRFNTPLGYELIEAPGNALFSHGFLFNYSQPATHTGIQAEYAASESWTFTYALVRGWDVWTDNNDAMSHLVGGAWEGADGRLSLLGNLLTGPERDSENAQSRTLLDGTASLQWTARLSTALSGNYGFERGGAQDGRDASWWGIAAYNTYRLAPRAALTTRAEYFRDQDGILMDLPGRVAEWTAGLDVTPLGSFPNLRARPEVRWDHALGGLQPFAGHSDQVTIAADLILVF